MSLRKRVKTTLRPLAFGAALLCEGGQALSSTYELRLFQVDDDMYARISNSQYGSHLLFQRGFGHDYGFVDITSYVRPGQNALTLSLFNGTSGYTYGYDFRIDGKTFATEACGVFNNGGCDRDSYAQGLVWI